MLLLEHDSGRLLFSIGCIQLIQVLPVRIELGSIAQSQQGHLGHALHTVRQSSRICLHVDPVSTSLSLQPSSKKLQALDIHPTCRAQLPSQASRATGDLSAAGPHLRAVLLVVLQVWKGAPSHRDPLAHQALHLAGTSPEVGPSSSAVAQQLPPVRVLQPFVMLGVLSGVVWFGCNRSC